jgi:guanine deaminase
MCLMTAKWANIKQIYFAATRRDAADIGFKDDDLYQLLKDGVYADPIAECREAAVAVMQQWYQKFGTKGQY